MSSSPANLSPGTSPPPCVVVDGFRPPEPSWTPPPPPSATTAASTKGKGAWRPSGVSPPAIAPPSPPTDGDDDDVPRRTPSPPSPVMRAETPTRRSNETIPMQIFNNPDAHRGRRSHDLPVRPADAPPQPTVLPSSTQWVTPHQDDEIRPATPRDAPIVRKPVSNHQFRSRPRAQSASQALQPTPGNRDSLPTFAQSQADYGHANPLHAHPVPEVRSHAPSEKLPIDQLLYQDHPDASFAPPAPVPPPPPAPAPVAPTTYLPTPQPEPSRSSSSLDLSRSTSTDSPSSAGSPAKGKWFASLGQKTSSGFNNLAQKFGGTGFVPGTLEKECDKAALILKTFCKEGVYADPVKVTDSAATPPMEGQLTTASTPKRPQAMMTIPTRIINEAVGLAIFTTFRAGLEFKFASGPGILVARLHDGSWSPPSAIQLHSFGGGFVAGMDIFDSVCVINTQEALADFMTKRVSIGGNVAAVAGPWGVGRAVDWATKVDNKGKGKDTASPDDSTTFLNSPPALPTLEVNGSRVKIDKEIRGKGGAQPKKFQPIFSYIKSRGFYAGVGYDGTVIQERKSANAAFYGKVVTCEEILRGQVPPPEDNAALQNLCDVLKGADGGHGRSTSIDATISPPIIEIAEQQPSIMVSGDGGSSSSSDGESTPLPPAYPVDSLHPAEAYAPEKFGRI